MKKYFFLAMAMLLPVSSAFAQGDNTFKKGDKVINAGVGFGTSSDLGKATLPPLALSVDFGVKDDVFGSDKISLGLGGYLGYASSKSEGVIEWKSTRIMAGARGTLHFQLLPKTDLYWGLMLGYRFASLSVDGLSGLDSGLSNGLSYSTFIGARYYFSERWAANLELGYGITTAQIGVSYKL